MSHSILLSELLQTRLCHDLSGPLGAIDNGVEFFRESGPDMQEKSMALIEISVKEAIERLLFFRQLFGKPNDMIETNFKEIHSISTRYLKQRHIELEWHPLKGDVSTGLHPLMGKTFLNFMYCVAGCLIGGGTVSAALERKEIVVTGLGNSIKADPELAMILAGEEGAPEMDNKNVHLYYLARFLREVGYIASPEVKKEKIVLRTQRV